MSAQAFAAVPAAAKPVHNYCAMASGENDDAESVDDECRNPNAEWMPR